MAWAGLDDFRARVASRLDAPEGEARLPETGDQDFLNDEERLIIRPAAVLIGVVPRETGASAVLTLRPNTMADHAGQVAFPGGKIDKGDSGPVAAALREAQEEIGLDPSGVEILGIGAAYVTGTRYRITPVVGLLPPDFVARPDPTEVAAVFETPLAMLMTQANYQLQSAYYKGQRRHYYEMSHDGYRIWGVTAGILNRLRDTLYEDAAAV